MLNACRRIVVMALSLWCAALLMDSHALAEHPDTQHTHTPGDAPVGDREMWQCDIDSPPSHSSGRHCYLEDHRPHTRLDLYHETLNTDSGPQPTGKVHVERCRVNIVDDNALDHGMWASDPCDAEHPDLPHDHAGDGFAWMYVGTEYPDSGHDVVWYEATDDSDNTGPTFDPLPPLFSIPSIQCCGAWTRAATVVARDPDVQLVDGGWQDELYFKSRPRWPGMFMLAAQLNGTTPLIGGGGSVVHLDLLGIDAAEAVWVEIDVQDANGAETDQIVVGPFEVLASDDPIRIEVADVTVTEGEQAVLTVRQTVLGAEGTVQYATSDGAAEAGSDYAAQAGSHDVLGARDTHTVAVDTLDDDEAEGTETFTVDLSSPDGDFAPFSVTVTVLDNDTADAGVAVSPPSGTITEGGNGACNVRLSSRPGAAVTVTANQPTDNPAVTVLPPATRTFTADDWDTDQAFAFVSADDAVYEPDGETATITFTVTSSDPDYDGVAVSDCIVAVIDNDPDPDLAPDLAPPPSAPAPLPSALAPPVVPPPNLPTRPPAAHTFDEADTPGCCTTLPQPGRVVYDYDDRQAMGVVAWHDAEGARCCPSLLWHRDDGRRGGGQPDAVTFWDDAEAYWWSELDAYETTRRRHEADKADLIAYIDDFHLRRAGWLTDAAVYAADHAAYEADLAQYTTDVEAWKADELAHEQAVEAHAQETIARDAEAVRVAAMPKTVTVAYQVWIPERCIIYDDLTEVCYPGHWETRYRSEPNPAYVAAKAALDAWTAHLAAEAADLAAEAADLAARRAALVARRTALADRLAVLTARHGQLSVALLDLLARAVYIADETTRLANPPADPGPHPVLSDSSVNAQYATRAEARVWDVWVHPDPNNPAPSPTACNSPLGS